jgi:hypothetical protein
MAKVLQIVDFMYGGSVKPSNVKEICPWNIQTVRWLASLPDSGAIRPHREI